jgi:hypothetical protein
VCGYFEYYGSPLKMEMLDNGSLRAFQLNRWTGEFEPSNSNIEPTLFAREQEIWRDSFDEYVTLAEET